MIHNKDRLSFIAGDMASPDYFGKKRVGDPTQKGEPILIIPGLRVNDALVIAHGY
jgi:hypothetical protein